MANINLLPWREWERERKKKEFGSLSLLVLIFAGAIIFFWGQMIDGNIEDQNARNAYVQGEVSKLDNDINEIRELQKRRQELIDRMNVIQDLQGNRPVIVHVFDALPRIMPDGVFFESLSFDGSKFSIDGVAESAANVSTLMRNFEDSAWFKKPNLKSVVAAGDNAKKFQLIVELELPSSAEGQ